MTFRGIAATITAGAVMLLTGCDRGTKDVFTDAEIASFIDNYETASEIAKSTRGNGTPLMWTLSDEDTDMHLFGTIHLLPPGLNWRSDEFNKAFEQAHTLVMEVTDADGEEDPDAGLGMLLAGMSETPLSERLSKRDYARVESAAAEFGIPITSIDMMKPWMAALTLEIAMVYSEGFEDSEGVEVVLEEEARQSGKKLAALETAEFQETLLDNLSERAQIEYLVSGASGVSLARDALALYLDEWLDGDFAGMNALATSETTEEYEGLSEFNDLLLKSRNEDWIPQIEDMLDTPGTIMIAVGAGHLEGPDSVILMLREKGYQVKGP